MKESCAATAERSLPQMPESVGWMRTHSGPGSAGGSTWSQRMEPSGLQAMAGRRGAA
ncbi:MAG TPA: hypothetical protein VF832_06410 [Longimicrobiales bacterium]